MDHSSWGPQRFKRFCSTRQCSGVEFCPCTLFVVFFPHLIAGPIVRHWEIIPQFAERTFKANLADASTGLALFLFGLYKKILLADPLGNPRSTCFR